MFHSVLIVFVFGLGVMLVLKLLCLSVQFVIKCAFLLHGIRHGLLRGFEVVLLLVSLISVCMCGLSSEHAY